MPSTGETSLTNLLQTLTVTISPQTYTFITLPPHSNPSNLHPRTPIQMLFREPTEDQWTMIIDSTSSDTLREFQVPGSETSPTAWKMLTLNVQSSLDAVGFMAVVAKALADVGVSANVVAAYLHDHIFVQADRAEAAKAAIEKVAEKARAQTRS